MVFTTQKLSIEQNIPSQTPGVNSCVPKGKAVSALHVPMSCDTVC